jgi:hypothetical protein
VSATGVTTNQFYVLAISVGEVSDQDAGGDFAGTRSFAQRFTTVTAAFNAAVVP